MSYFAGMDALKRQHEDLAARTVEYARSLGAQEVAVRISVDKGVEISSRQSDIENIEFNQRYSMNINVTTQKRNAEASTTDFSWDKIKDTVAAAINLSNYASPDEFSGLCDAELLYQGDRDLELLYASDEDVDHLAQRTLDFYKKGAEAAAEHKAQGIRNCERAALSAWYSLGIMATSHGFLHSVLNSSCDKNISFIAEKDGDLQHAGSFSSDCNEAKLWSDEKVVAEAVKKTLGRLGGKQVPTGTYAVILQGRAAQIFLGPYLKGVSGRLLHRRSSFLLDSLGKQVFPSFLSIREDPWLKGRLASANYDEDGVAMKPMVLVDQGKVCTYLLGTYASRKLNLPCNGHASGVSNLFVETDPEHTVDFEQLLKQAGTGLVIDSLMGQGINMVTGNYSRGASGYFFKDGERVHAVNEITIAANLKDMYASVACLGNDYDDRYSIKTGSVLLPAITVSGS